MSTTEKSFMFTRNITHRQQQRQQQLSAVTELAITSSIPNPRSSSSPLSTPATIVTASPDPIKFQKPFSNFIDVIVAAFTAFLLTWRMLISSGEKTKDKISIDLNCKDNSSLIKDIDSSADATSATTSAAITAMDSSSIESLKTLLSTDNISNERLTVTASGHQQYHLTESQVVPQCSIPQDIKYFLRYGSNTYNTDRYLLAIPELEEEKYNSMLVMKPVFSLSHFQNISLVDVVVF